MTSHELARKLLALPDLQTYHSECLDDPKVIELIDDSHPDFKPYEGKRWVKADPEFQKWYASQPKCNVVSLG